jgi:CRISPR/Cas system-associated protein Cas5 (RAMP superfamily)
MRWLGRLFLRTNLKHIDEDEALKTLGNDVERLIEGILFSFDRIGDSESLVSVKSVELENVCIEKPDSEVVVNTVIEEELGNIISGSYIYTIMPSMFDRKQPKGYFVPLSVMEDRTDVYFPSEFTVKPKKDVNFVKTKDISILFSR